MKDILPALITISGQGLIAFLAWKQFQKNYEQRNEEIKQRESQFKTAEDNKFRQFNDAQQNTLKQFQDRKDQEKVNAENKAQQDQFVDIQNRLSSPEAMIRASAALRLGEYVRTPRARTRTEERETPVLPRTEENFPFFIPATLQLSTALYLEPRAEVREAIKKALEQMAVFANVEIEGEQPLLHPLIWRLRDVNRTAKGTLIEMLAAYTIATTEPTKPKGIDDGDFMRSFQGIPSHHEEIDLNFVASVAPFCSTPEATIVCLQDLMVDGERKNEKGKVARRATYAIQCNAYRLTRQTQTTEEQMKANASALPSLRTAARQLIDTRDALATALRELEVPTGFDTKFSVQGEHDTEEISRLFVQKYDQQGYPLARGWERQPELDLCGCFLAGAVLKYAQLQEALLNDAYLSGANMQGVQLQGAKLRNAKLQVTYLRHGKLQGADLTLTDLSVSDLIETKLQCAIFDAACLLLANLYGADLRNTQLSDAHLQGARLQFARLEGADLSGAQLDQTNLYKIAVQEDDSSSKYRKTNFASSSWDRVPNENMTQELRNWLKDNFLPMPPEEVVPLDAVPAQLESTQAGDHSTAG